MNKRLVSGHVLLLALLLGGGSARSQPSPSCSSEAVRTRDLCFTRARATELDRPMVARGAACDAAWGAEIADCNNKARQLLRDREIQRIAERTRLQDEAVEAKAIMAKLETIAAPAWYEEASEEALSSLPGDVTQSLQRLAVLSVDLGKGSLPDPVQASALTEVQQRIATERACRASKKCMADRAAKKAEAEFFTNVVGPMCQADQLRETAQADMVRERSNPSGVVNLHLLHEDGDEILTSQKTIADMIPEYVKTRHHPWRGWRAECE